jgi:uncharacterized membrane protein YgcG
MHPARFRNFVSRTIVGASLVLGALPAFAFVVDIPHPAPVVDLTGTLTGVQEAALQDKIANIDAQTGAQVEILMVPSTGEETAQSYSWRVAETWRPGHGQSKGIVVVIAKNDHASFIQVGTGLDSIITSELAHNIAHNAMTPSFKAHDFYGGLDHGLDSLGSLIAANTMPVSNQASPVVDEPSVPAQHFQPSVQPVPVMTPSVEVITSRNALKETAASTLYAGLVFVVVALIFWAGYRIVFGGSARKSQRTSTTTIASTTRSSLGTTSKSVSQVTGRVSSDAQSANSASATSTGSASRTGHDALFGKDFDHRKARPSPAVQSAPSRPARSQPVSSVSSSTSRSRTSSTSSSSRNNDDDFARGYATGSLLSSSRDDDSRRSPSSDSDTSNDTSYSTDSFSGSGGGDSWSD